MTKKARDTKTPPAEVGALAAAAVTTPGPDAKSATEPAAVKKQPEESLMDWVVRSLALVGRDATKAALKAALKQCDPPPKKSGPKTKPPDIQALHFIGRTSKSAIQAEGFSDNLLGSRQRTRQRAVKKIMPTVNEVMLRLLIAAGVDTKTPGAVEEFCRAMNDTPTALQVLGKANAEIDAATIIATDE